MAKIIISSLLSLIAYSILTDMNPPEKGENDIQLFNPSGQVVDNFAIGELFSLEKGNKNHTELDSVHLRSTWIYEKGPGITPDGSPDRNYGLEFFKNSSRFICWEVFLEHPSYIFNSDFNFIFTLFDDRGNKLAKHKADSWIPANNEFSEHSACWGWPYPSNWNIGVYYYQVEIDTNLSPRIGDFPIKIPFKIL